MGSHSSAKPENGFIHGNPNPFFNPSSARETTITFDSENSYKFPDAVMYYLIDTGTIIDHEGKFPEAFVNDVMNSKVVKQNTVTHRGESGPKARGELKKGDTGYCEQEDIDRPLGWKSQTASFGDFVRQLLTISPQLKQTQLGGTSIDSIIDSVEPLISDGTVIHQATKKAVPASNAAPTTNTPATKYTGSYTASKPKNSRDGKSVEIELTTSSFGENVAPIMRALEAAKPNGPAGVIVEELKVRGPSVIKITLPISAPDQGTTGSSVEIAKGQLQDFVANALPGIKQDRGLV